MSQQGQRPTDEDVARIQRRMRFENRSGVAIVIALTLGGLAVLIVPTAAIGTVLAVTCAVVFVATIGWMVGYFRTNRAFARIQSEPASRQPRWKYVAALGAAAITGLAFVLFPQYSRLLWYAFIIASGGTFIWVLYRRRRPSSRR